MRTFVARYGSPETRREIEHSLGTCPACEAAGGVREGGIIFMVVEYPDGEEIRRVEGLGPLKTGEVFAFPEYRTLGLVAKPVSFVNGCRAVTREEAEAEISLAHQEGRTPS